MRNNNVKNNNIWKIMMLKKNNHMRKIIIYKK